MTDRNTLTDVLAPGTRVEVVGNYLDKGRMGVVREVDPSGGRALVEFADGGFLSAPAESFRPAAPVDESAPDHMVESSMDHGASWRLVASGKTRERAESIAVHLNRVARFGAIYRAVPMDGARQDAEDRPVKYVQAPELMDRIRKLAEAEAEQIGDMTEAELTELRAEIDAALAQLAADKRQASR